jgi:hypothetical protein
MGIYDIGFIVFRVIVFFLICAGVSKNVLTKYGVGILLAVLFLGIIGYDIWATFQVKESINRIDLAPSGAEKEIFRQELTRKIGTRP